MKISPRYQETDWEKLSFCIEADWQKGVDILEDRLRGRFLQLIDRIEEDEFAGFCVLALDCLLIETLQQFHEGVDNTPRYKSRNYFVNFLTTTSFKKYFDKKKAELFYEDIRCGILHQAETKRSSIIRIGDIPLVEYTKDSKGIIINRKKFHEVLKSVFNDYLKSLRDTAFNDKTLRLNFRKKMDFICKKK